MQVNLQVRIPRFPSIRLTKAITDPVISQSYCLEYLLSYVKIEIRLALCCSSIQNKIFINFYSAFSESIESFRIGFRYEINIECSPPASQIVYNIVLKTSMVRPGNPSTYHNASRDARREESVTGARG